jgi:hypothetical protein
MRKILRDAVFVSVSVPIPRAEEKNEEAAEPKAA